MNSLSCLSRFSRDPPNVVSILIQKMNLFFFILQAQFFFYGYYRQGQNPSVFLFVFVHLWKMAPTPSHYYTLLNLPKMIEFQPREQTVTIPLTFD